MTFRRSVIIWCAVVTAVIVPTALAANSPLLQWRDPVYIVAGFAGVIAMMCLLFQPLLAAGYLPGITKIRGRRAHRFVGIALVISIIVHIAGLWITSPPDVVDALLFRSATPFSLWGVIAMWGALLTAALVAARKQFRTKPHTWKTIHKILGAIIVAGTVVHAVLIDGTMESISKYLLCALLVFITFAALRNSSDINTRFTSGSTKPGSENTDT